MKGTNRFQGLKALVIASALCVSCSATSAVSIVNATNELSADFVSRNDTLLYNLSRSGKSLMTDSPILLELNSELIGWRIKSNKSESIKDSFDMLTGEISHVDTEYRQNTMTIEGKTKSGKRVDGELIVRLYDHALAYRVVLDLDEGSLIKERSAYCFPGDDGAYFTPDGEAVPLGPMLIDDIDPTRDYLSPIVYTTAEYALGLHESDLHNYPQLSVTRNDSNQIAISTDVATLGGRTELPWRVVMEGDNMADLHNDKEVYLSLSKAAEGDYSWVKPGKSTWDWRVKGTTFNGERYEMTTKSLKRYIDFCARNNIEYFLLDSDWNKKGNPLEPINALDLIEVVNYGLDRGVGLMLYYDQVYVNQGNAEVDFEIIAKTYASWGVKGIKYGFLGTIGAQYTPQGKVKRTEEVIQIAGRNHLMVDFHDRPIPHGGLWRQYPNYISREYCHAQMDRRLSFSPGAFVKMACINFLAGPMDQTNGTYALNTIKERSKGPTNDYNSTVASETARFFITHTGNLSVLIDAPEAYEQKSDIFDFIKHLPSRWDEVKYLDMDFERLVSLARRSGTTWFVGTVFAEQGDDHSITLDFLEEGKEYTATIYSDAADTHYITNKESYKVSTQSVKHGDTITTTVVDGGGYSLMINANND